MSDHAVSLQPAAAPRVQYRRYDPAQPLPGNVLAAVVFTGTAARRDDPRIIEVGLTPLQGAGISEMWHAQETVRTAHEDAIRYAFDAEYLFGVIELDERRHGGIAGAAEAAYGAIRRFQQSKAHPYLLRVWNHFDGINRGAGDAERYRQFCVGRAAGLGDWQGKDYPAATAIGRRDGDPTLQVYWLAGRLAGRALENPRQVNPYRYPRAYGPTAPQFSRAMRVANGLVMLSGTASIVGHASHHPGDLRAQLDESLLNLRSVLEQAAVDLDRATLLKIYVREARALELVQSVLRAHLPDDVPRLILEGDICREDLLVEIEGVRTVGTD